MSKKLQNDEDLRRFLTSAIRRAEHHGKEVRSTVYTLAGAILAHRDPKEPIRAGSSVVWVMINGQRYAFSYNHKRKAIDMRFGSIRGQTLLSFDDDELGDVYAAFAGLREVK